MYISCVFWYMVKLPSTPNQWCVEQLLPFDPKTFFFFSKQVPHKRKLPYVQKCMNSVWLPNVWGQWKVITVINKDNSIITICWYSVHWTNANWYLFWIKNIDVLFKLSWYIITWTRISLTWCYSIAFFAKTHHHQQYMYDGDWWLFKLHISHMNLNRFIIIDLGSIASTAENWLCSPHETP